MIQWYILSQLHNQMVTMIQGDWFYKQHKQNKWFNYNNGLHNFHTIIFTIIPSTITNVHGFHEFHQQKISFEPNDQNMSNENIIIKWKVYEKLHTILFFYSPTTAMFHVQWQRKWSYNFIFILLLKK
jgi:hypothetical protein